MSIEEDVELRDLIAQTLESNGALAKIRAQLRASVCLALEEDEKVSKKKPLLNNKLKSYQKTAQGKAAFCLVREFLDFFHLDFTISVYEPESYSGTGYKYEGRQKLINDLGISELDLSSSGPVLLQLLKIAQNSKHVLSEGLPEDIDTSVGDATFYNGEVNGINHDDDNETEEDASKSKTDSINLVSNSSDVVSNKNVINKLKSNAESISSDHPKKNKIDLEIEIPRVTLNQTYDISSSITEESNESVSSHNSSNSLDEKLEPHLETLLSPQSLASTKEETDKEDTDRDTNSIPEDKTTEKETSYEGSSKYEKNSRNSLTKSNSNNDNTCPPLKDNKSLLDADKLKPSPQKCEKLKPKGNLSSLSDLPPLPLGKSRMSDILPSPYNKEFKEKSNLKELDEMFDMQVDYEEDFMSGSEADLSSHNNSDHKGSISHTGKLSNNVGTSNSENAQDIKDINGEHASDSKQFVQINGNDDHNKTNLSPGNSTSSIGESLENDSTNSQLQK